MSIERRLLLYLRTDDINHEYVESLLKIDVNFRVKCKEDGLSTALLYASGNPNVGHEVIELLLQNGAKVNATNFNDGLCTPLLYATRNRNMNYEVIEVLLRNGAIVEAGNCRDGKCTPLIYAVRNRKISYKIIEVLLRYGAHIHSTNDKDGQCTPLLYAIMNPNASYDVIQFLLEQGASIHSKNANNNKNVLIHAVGKRDIDPAVLELLLHYEREGYYTREYKQLRKIVEPTRPCEDCLQVLKYIVLDRVRKNSKCINVPASCQSVMGDVYYRLFKRHFWKNSFISYVKDCVVEVRRMKEDGIYPLFFPSSSNKRLKFAETCECVKHLLSLWSQDNIYPVYSKMAQAEMEIMDLLNVVPRFRIYTKSSARKNARRKTYLDYDATLLVLEQITLQDALHLLEAFYQAPKKAPTSNRRLSSRKRQKLC